MYKDRKKQSLRKKSKKISKISLKKIEYLPKSREIEKNCILVFCKKRYRLNRKEINSSKELYKIYKEELFNWRAREMN